VVAVVAVQDIEEVIPQYLQVPEAKEVLELAVAEQVGHQIIFPLTEMAKVARAVQVLLSCCTQLISL
jgi:hypothetical protein